GVGKTSIITRYLQKKFVGITSPTIGASFQTVKVTIDNALVSMQIWDTAGQERFRAMAPLYYRKANAAIIVYDITSPNSFEAMKHWVTELRRNVEEVIGIFIVGNKCDLCSNRVISQEAARKFAESIGGNFFECSALSNEGIDDVFRELALSIAEAEDKADTTGQLTKCCSLPQEAMLSGSTNDSFALSRTITIDKLSEPSEPKESSCFC
ncbi:unnamed protein product, partial [Ixodes hexagonus]